MLFLGVIPLLSEGEKGKELPQKKRAWTRKHEVAVFARKRMSALNNQTDLAAEFSVPSRDQAQSKESSSIGNLTCSLVTTVTE